jgi:hypothetical protein
MGNKSESLGTFRRRGNGWSEKNVKENMINYLEKSFILVVAFNFVESDILFIRFGPLLFES